MSEGQNKRYWFRPKRYGWGYGLPLTWQGWLLMAAHIGVIITATLLIIPEDDADVRVIDVLLLFAVIGLATAVMMAIASNHAPPMKWRWGDKDNETEGES